MSIQLTRQALQKLQRAANRDRKIQRRWKNSQERKAVKDVNLSQR